MAYLGVSVSGGGLETAQMCGDLDGALATRLAGLGADAPVVILVHGYKFDPAGAARDNPHRSLFSYGAETGPKVRSWPEGLGFHPEAPEGGLCIGFAWPAVEPHLPNLIASGRTGFARVYERAGLHGASLAALIRLIQQLAPGRAVDILAHSLGARVALAALPHLETAPGRMILLGAAEFDARAREALIGCPAPRLPEIYNITARANDFYDAMFETFAPRQTWRDRAVGLGLREPLPCWLDIQLDRPELTDWVNSRGIALEPAAARLCHWSFYTRDGAFGVYQAILRRQPDWDIAGLADEPCFAAQEPRWSRIAPRAPRRLPRPRLPQLPAFGLRRA